MRRQRWFDPQKQGKIGVLSKFLMVIGLILLVISIVIRGISVIAGDPDPGDSQLLTSLMNPSVLDIIGALSILFLGIGGILYFFHHQFSKLAKLHKEIETDEEGESHE